MKNFKKIWGETYDFTKYIYNGSHEKGIVICPIHGEFKSRACDLLHGHGCPECGKKLNKSEKYVLSKIKEHFENVEYQKTFDFLHGKTSAQTLDIYLPDFNVAIEYQGKQHFQPLQFFGGKERYTKTIEQDLRKYNKCKEHGIKIFYITFEKNIPNDYFEY